MIAWLQRRAALALCIMLFATGLASSAFAQVGTGTLVGSVKDASDQKSVGDVVVTVTSPALQGEEIAVTGATGEFRLGGLPPGDYTIRMDKEGYRPYSRAGIRVRADVTLRVDMQILPEGLKQDIVIVGRPPTVDVGSTSTGSNIDKEFVRRVPTIRPGGKGSDTRSIESVASTAPQAKADSYGVSISGTTSPENNYVIDGLSVGDPAFGTIGTPMSIEFVDELNIITGGYLPEYGKSTGGILNAITRSGSDEFETSLWGYLTPGVLTGERKIIKSEASTVDVQAGDSNTYDFGFAIGGPILKERLWFYVGADFAVIHREFRRSLRRIVYDDAFAPQVDSDGFTVTEEIDGTAKNYYAESRTLQVFGKLTYRADAANRLSLTLLAGPRWSGGDGDFSIDPQSGGSNTSLGGDPTRLTVDDSMTFDAMLKWNSDLIDNKLLLETSVGWHYQKGGSVAADGTGVGSKTGDASEVAVVWRRTPNAAGRTYHDIRDFEELPNPTACDAPEGAPEGTLPCPVQSYTTGGPGYLSNDEMSRIGARSILTWLPEAAGQHVLKLGAEFDYLAYSIDKGYSGGIVYRESTSGGSFTDYRAYGYLQGPDDAVPLDVSGSDTYSVSVGAFLQDSWTLTKGLTANLGMRWDGQWLQNHDGDTVIALANQWAPRLGLVWDPTAEGGAKIFANVALFYESIPLNLLDRAGSGDPTVISVKAKAACDPSDPEQANTTCLEDDSRVVINGPESPDQLWYAYGAGRTAVDPDLQAQSSWEFVTGAEYDLGRITDYMKDLRAGVLYTKRWMNNVIEDMSRDEAQTYFIGNPGSGIAKDFDEAKRNYDAVTLYFMKEFSDCWLLQGSYTMSWLKGNYAGLFRPETGQLDPNINSDFDLKSLTVNRDGYLPGDSRHAFKLFGAHDIELAKGHRLQPGYGWRLTSGSATNYLGSHPLYGGDEVFLLPRGAGDRLPWVQSIDLSLGYEVQVTEGFKLNFIAEVFNVFNFQEVTSRDESYTYSDVDPIRNGKKSDLEGLTDLYGDPVEVNPNFGKTTSYQAPRTFRFGIRGTL